MSRIFEALQRTEKVGPSHLLSVRDRAASISDDRPAEESDEITAAVETASGEDIERAAGETIQLLPRSESRLVSITDPAGLGAEQFRLLGVRLSNLQREHKFKRVLITSSVSEDGKTMVAANLALTLSRNQNKRVLLIEGDLRRPKLGACLGLPALPGLTEMVKSTEPSIRFVHPIEGSSLWYLPAGTATDEPGAALHSPRLSDLLDSLSPKVDYVIVDSAPILPLADANLWLRLTDGMLLVIRQMSTPKTALAQALTLLDKPTLIGIVFNGAKEVMPAYGHYYKSYSAQKR